MDRATPTVVDVLTGVLVTTALDQARRQLAALGVAVDDTHESVWSPAIPSETQALAYVALLAIGGLIAAWTCEPAIETAVSLVRVVAALDVSAFDLAAFVVMAVFFVFFVSFETAAYALDRLLIGGPGRCWPTRGDGVGYGELCPVNRLRSSPRNRRRPNEPATP